MSEHYLIGVDIGTQGVKAVLYSSEGKCLANGFHPSQLYRPDEITVEEDPNYQFQSACQVIRKCLLISHIDPKEVAGIAVAGQMAGVIGIDSEGMAITPYDSWLDRRCTPFISELEQQAGEEILHKSGCAPGLNHAPKILWWKKKQPKVYRNIQAFVQPGSYVAMQLAGLKGKDAYIDRSYLHFSGFANNPKSMWDESLCQQFKIEMEKFPRILHSHEIIGHTSGAKARKAGLPAGIPILAGCGDTAASFLACGATRPGICVDVAGTASVFASTTDHFCADKKYHILACGQSATPGLWHPYAYISGGGMNLEWFRKEIAGINPRTGQPYTFEELNQLAAKVCKGIDSPLFIPHLGGKVCPSDPKFKGAWVGLNWKQDIAHLYYAILEGVALEYRLYRMVLNKLYSKLKISEIRITGGGEKSPIWNQMKAAALAAPVYRIEDSQGAAMGAAMVAGFGIGFFKSLDQAASDWIHPSKPVKPKPTEIKDFEQRFQAYQELDNCVGYFFNLSGRKIQK